MCVSVGNPQESDLFLLWDLGMKLRLSGPEDKHLYLPSNLTVAHCIFSLLGRQLGFFFVKNICFPVSNYPRTDLNFLCSPGWF